MDYPNRTKTHCGHLLFFCAFVFFQFGFAQEIHVSSVDDELTVKADLLSLIKDFKYENEVTQAKLGVLFSNHMKSTENGRELGLVDLGEDGTPLFYTTYANISSYVSRANSLYTDGLLNLGLDGAGMQVGVWDAGVALNSHQEFQNRVRSGDASNDISSHATLVTGNLVSTGLKPDAKGVAFKANAISHDWTRDKIEVAEAAAQGLLLSNHSYGIKSDRVPDWYFGSYIKVSQDWDKIMYNAPYYLMVTAAGNAQRSKDNASPVYGQSVDGFDMLLGFATSKNGITVGAAKTTIGNQGQLKHAEVSTYSSLGPIDDGRIKPDLVGDGASIFSTTSKNNTSYGTSTGTSMAAPGVTGALLLLQQYAKQSFGSYVKAATVKGLALHTADDVGVAGPDYKMGWGVMNAMNAAKVIQNDGFTSIIEENTLLEGEEHTINIRANGSELLLISISWIDPEGNTVNSGILNDPTKALVNDLDIRLEKNGKVFLPWRLNPKQAAAAATRGDNSVDPFERIDVADAKGEYTLVISHKESLTNSEQAYSLIVSGAKVNQCSAQVPEEVGLESTSENGVAIHWGGVPDTLYEVQFKTASDDHWMSYFTEDSTQQFENLENEKTYNFRIRSICTESVVSEFSENYTFTFDGENTVLEENSIFSIDDNALQIEVFPNPASDWVTITSPYSSNAMFALVSTSGNTLRMGSVTEKINVSDLASGLYILMVQDLEGIRSTKFYKK